MNLLERNRLTIIFGVFAGIFFLVLWVASGATPDKALGNKGLIILLSIATVTAIVLMIIDSITYRRKRTRELQLTAQSLGWKYNPKPDLPFLAALADWLELNRDHALRSNFTEGLTGRLNGRDFVIFDGRCRQGPDSDFSYYQTIFAIRIKGADLPLFGLEPETLGSKISDALRPFDIDFHSHPIFSKKHALYGSDEERIRRLFSDEVLNHFQSQKPLSVFAYQDHLVIYRHSEICRADTLEFELRAVLETAEILVKTNRPSTIKPPVFVSGRVKYR
ncbi:MAG: hypothetical protein R2747_21825 [Pyrinomonadaceae bacterium]